MKTPKLIEETFDARKAEELYWSGQWSKPIWNENRGYILIKKASEVNKLRASMGE